MASGIIATVPATGLTFYMSIATAPDHGLGQGPPLFAGSVLVSRVNIIENGRVSQVARDIRSSEHLDEDPKGFPETKSGTGWRRYTAWHVSATRRSLER